MVSIAANERKMTTNPSDKTVDQVNTQGSEMKNGKDQGPNFSKSSNRLVKLYSMQQLE